MSTLTPQSFGLLLKALDPDERSAAAKYELLRTKLTSLLIWRGCAESDADDLADVTFDRVAGKIAGGETVENISAYSASVARFILLEHKRKKKEDAAGDEMPEVAVDPDVDELEGDDERMECLRECLRSSVPNPNDQRLIIGYYDAGANEKNKDSRKKLALSLGLSLNTMKVRACRLRERLERCINDCVARVTEVRRSRTKRREVMNG